MEIVIFIIDKFLFQGVLTGRNSLGFKFHVFNIEKGRKWLNHATLENLSIISHNSHTSSIGCVVTNTPRKTSGRGWTLDNVGIAVFVKKQVKKGHFPHFRLTP